MIVAGMASAGCTMRDVSMSDLSGTWTMTGESRKYLGSEGLAATIRLDQGGTFSAREVPGSLLHVEATARSRSVTGDGTWKLTARDGRQEVRLVFDAIASPSNHRIPYGTQLHVWRSRSSLLLFYFEGDPDDGRRIEFEKTKPGA
jgi:hypothetical protein